MLMEPTPLEQLALTLYDIGAVRFGRFQLHSGKTSPIYIDLRVLVSYPHALRQVAQAYAAVLADLSFDVLAAYPYAGLPIGVAISLEMERPLIYPRKTAKAYGTGKQVEGVWQVGQKAVLIEDLITSGKSVLEAMAALKAAGILIQEAVVLINRQQDGVQVLQEHGYQVHCLMTLAQLLAALEKHERLPAKERMRVLRALDIPL